MGPKLVWLKKISICLQNFMSFKDNCLASQNYLVDDFLTILGSYRVRHQIQTPEIRLNNKVQVLSNRFLKFLLGIIIWGKWLLHPNFHPSLLANLVNMALWNLRIMNSETKAFLSSYFSLMAWVVLTSFWTETDQGFQMVLETGVIGNLAN